MELKHLSTGYCCYHNIAMLIEEANDRLKRIFLIGYLPASEEYQVLRL
jgi:hypothetical protein